MMLSLNDWIEDFQGTQKTEIGFLNYQKTDFSIPNNVFIDNLKKHSNNGTRLIISENNLYETCIYFAVHNIIDPSQLNDKDSFSFPNVKYRNNNDFQNDCLIFTLFHEKNRISVLHSVNHWIPFTSQEVGASVNFQSSFMNDFIKGKKIQ